MAGGVIRVAQPCGCVQEHFMGQKREKLCPCGNLFEKPEIVEARTERKRERVKSPPLKRRRNFGASDAQRTKVKGEVCVGCGKEATEDESLVIDPAHLWPRSKGGCNDPDCVLGLCRFVPTGEGCHRLFDEGKLDLLERLTGKETFQVELAHPILVHGVGLVELVRRLSGNSYEFVKTKELAA